jgi:acetylornithine deacetylase
MLIRPGLGRQTTLTTTLEQQIIRAVEDRQSQIVRLLRELVRIDSRTGSEGRIQRYLTGLLTEMGLAVDVFEPDLESLAGHPGYEPVPGLSFAGRPNVVGVLRGEPGARSLVLNGHVDTIPPGQKEEWVQSPFSGAIHNEQLYGRGSSDMKGGIVAMVASLGVLLDLGLRPRGAVTLELVVDEEMTGYGTLACIQRGYRADAGICTETSDLQIMPACIGRLWFTVEVRGRSAGIATRWLAVDAIEKGIKIVRAVADLEQMRLADLTHPLYPDNRTALPCAVTMFHAGTFPSATPEVAVLRGSLGLLPQEDVQAVKRQFCRQIDLICQADPWLRDHPPHITFKDVGADGAEIPTDHPIVTTVSDAFRSATGRQPVLSGRTGGADTRFLIKYGQTPTVIFGPGVTAQMHMTNESVPVPYVVDATKTLALAIHRWCR